MGVQFSDAVRNGRVDAIETVIGTSALLRLYTGAQPANCAAAASGTLLATIILPTDWMAAASGGAASKAGTWSGTGAAAGVAAHYRIYNSAGTVCGEQGPVSKQWSASTAYSVGNQVANEGNIYQCTTAGTSAASGGPSGTGTGITDGTAVWSYVEPAALVLDNTNIAVSQPITINTWTKTDGNA